MKKYVLDAWAWIEYLDGSKVGAKVSKLMKNAKLFTNAVTIAEVISKVERRSMDSGTAFNAITSISQIILPNELLSRRTGSLHSLIKKSRPNFSLGDAFVLQTAMDLKAKVLTGDVDFKGLKQAELVA